MSDTILSGDFTVYYKAENRQQRITWTGDPGGTRTVRELYSALMDLFDETAQMDDSVPMSTQTPTEYTIGKIEAVDTDSWFIDNETTKHLKGGSISTSSWLRVEGSNAGIVHVVYEVGGGSDFVVSDIGKTVTHSDGDSGTLLDFHVEITGELEAVIRPTSSSGANNWDSNNGTVSVTSGVGSVTQLSPATSGNSLWASIFTLGTLASGTEIYVTQDFIKLNTWWSTGHIDILVQVQEVGALVDFGFVTVYAREFGNLYDHFTVDASAGGRNPIPLATSNDANNNTSAGTIGALTGITFNFGATQENIGDGSGNQPYDVVIDCGGNRLDDFYEYTKYITQRTATTPLFTDYYSRNGEQYITVGELRIEYDGQTGAFTEGDVLTGPVGTALIVADHNNGDNTGTLIVRDVRGTFNDDNALSDETTGVANVIGTPEDTLISKTAPFGTFAGGNFFGARGVWISNMHGDDANSYQLIDSNNVVRTPPATVAIAVNSVVAGDRVSVFRATDQNGTINKSVFNIFDTHTAPETEIRVEESIPSDTPATGTIRVVQRNAGGSILGEVRYAYESWNNDDQPSFSTFILDTSGPVTTNIDYGTNDTAYVPYIDTEATGTSVSVSVQFVTTRNMTTRVRIKGIVPFTVNSVDLTSTGYSVNVIRATDTIVD